MRVRDLVLSVGSLGAANIIGKLCWVLSLMLMMRALGPEEYGLLAAIWSLFGFIAPLTDLGLSQLLVRDGARDPSLRAYLLRGAVACRLVIGGVAVAGMLLLSAWLDGPFSHAGWLILFVAALPPLFDGAFQTATAVAQLESRLVLLSACRVFGFALLPLMLLYSLFTYDNGVAAAGSYAAASLIALLGFFVLRRNPEASTPLDSPLAFRRLARQALPFMFVSTAALAYGKLEVVAVGMIEGTAASAYYHLAYQVVLLAFSLPEVFFLAILANLYRVRGDVPRIERKWGPICDLMCAYCSIVLPGLVWHAADIVAFLGGEGFRGSAPVLWALLPMVALLPASTSMHFLMVLDQPARRAWIDLACVAITVPMVAMMTALGGVVPAAAVASAIYGAAVWVAWRVVAGMGLRLQWLRPMGLGILTVSPSFVCWALPWPTWWFGAVVQAMIASLLLIGTGFIGKRHVISLLES